MSFDFSTGVGERVLMLRSFFMVFDGMRLVNDARILVGRRVSFTALFT